LTNDLDTSVRLLRTTRSYADGSEDRVLAVLEAVADRSDGSDELARHMVDWPTTYHFSPRRGNLLRPLEIDARHRVLEIGAGTGALTRHLGERGASVIALEGEPKRARAAALRCSDLTNVEVVCGALNAFGDDSGFDFVIVVGVLEYAGGASPDDRDQVDFLRRTVDLMRPDGVLVLAIENQIGLKYLLGFSEDHLAEPWAGIEGYPGNPPTRTFSKARLRSLVERSGLTAQRWLYPYPDYKLPTTILTDEVFELPGSTEIVDQLVSSPVIDLAHPPTRFCDDRSSHQVFLNAGLGPEVANSFLVLAARRESALEGVVDDTAVAWLYSRERRRRYRRSQVIRRAGDGLRLVADSTHAGEPIAQSIWLQHDPHKDEWYLVGRTLEQQALEACRQRDVEGLAGVLVRWRGALAANGRTTPARTTDAGHPFSAGPEGDALPSEYLDASLSNFVDTGDALVFVDREWRAGSSVDGDLVRTRALWYFALDLVTSGTDQPFDAGASVNAVTLRLAELAGLDLDEGSVEELLRSEPQLQSIVTGAEPATIERELRQLGSTSRSSAEAAATLPVAQIRRDLVQLGEMLQTMRSQAEIARQYQLELEAELAVARNSSGDVTKEQLARCRSRRERLEEELDKAAGWAHELHDLVGQKEAAEAELQQVLESAAARQHDLDAAYRRLEAWALDLQETVIRRTKERDFLDYRVELVNHERDLLRKWKDRASRNPLMRAALAIHRIFDRKYRDR
jgi:2-polyprenyl-3-methyl-5-hydroxy-6-metoxy-1,4-benzoquinol methylase